MRLRLIAVASLCCLALSACGPHGEAKDAVKSMLNDPDSAKFSHLSNGVGKGDVCGLVNAKNRMGGYVGDTPFYYQKLTMMASMVKPPEERDFKSLWISKRAGNSSDEYVELAMKCRAAKKWPEICGTSYPARMPEMCDEFDEGKNIYNFLDEKYGR